MNTTSPSSQPSPEQPAEGSSAESAPEAAQQPAAAKNSAGKSGAASATGSRGALVSATSVDASSERQKAGRKRAPLTPEELAEEVRRGDFMLRWAVVLLAVLLGCTVITETETLVHIKSGQYVLQHGLPPRTDVFSSTAQQRPWINLNWLFDVVTAALYGIGSWWGGGDAVLSVFTGGLAATLIGVLVHTNRKDVSTWWGTICAVVALLACYRQFTARPEIITLLGVALTLHWLHRWREEDRTKWLKALVVLFLLWGNLDPRMFVGLVLLVLYAVGETLGAWLGIPGLHDDRQRRQLWMTVGGCIAVTLLNPFGWNAVLSPLSLYSLEYPAWQQYAGVLQGYEQIQFLRLTDPAIWSWELFSYSVGAGLLLLLMAVVTLGLNYRRLDLGDVFLLLGGGGLAVLAVHELAAAAVVAAMLATLNAQQWYRHTFRQTYSVQTSEVIFSRAGRAVCVLLFLGIAYLALSGVSVWGVRFHRRTSVGFHPDLAAALRAVEKEVKNSYDNRPFNFVPEQGDLLIWANQQPFLDSRLKVFAGRNQTEDLVGLHLSTRQAILEGRREGKEEGWKTVLDRFRITHVMPRLETRLKRKAANYRLFLNLFTSPDWRLTALGASSAVFYRTDLTRERKDDGRYAHYLAEHEFDLVDRAFGQEAAQDVRRLDWPQTELFWWQKYLRRPLKFTPNAIEECRHYARLMQLCLDRNFPARVGPHQRDPYSLAVASGHLSIRRANAGLQDEARPHHPAGYRSLGLTYFTLSQLEQNFVRVSALQKKNRLSPDFRQQLARALGPVRRRRFRQSAGCFYLAWQLVPDDLATIRTLARLFYEHERYDLALQMLERAEAVATRKGRPADKEKSKALQRDIELQRVIREQDDFRRNEQVIHKQRSTLSRNPADRNKRWQLARFAAFGILMGQNNRVRIVPGAGSHVGVALELFEEDPGLAAENPLAAIDWVDCLQQAGRFEEAGQHLQALQEGNERLQKMGFDQGIEEDKLPFFYQGVYYQAKWRTLLAYQALLQADYNRARGLWYNAAARLNHQRLSFLMDTLPLGMVSPAVVQRELAYAEQNQFGSGLWPIDQILSMDQALRGQAQAVAILYLNAALTDLEAGRRGAALAGLRRILQVSPDTPLRPLVEFYLIQLTGSPSGEPSAGSSSRSGQRVPLIAPRP